MGDSDGAEASGDVRYTLEGGIMAKQKREHSCFTESTCPVCGKSFFPTPEWVYNTGIYSGGILRRVCSYKCHLKARDKQKGKREIDKEMRELRDREIYMLYREGVEHTELAERYKLTSDRIWKILRQQKALDVMEPRTADSRR